MARIATIHQPEHLPWLGFFAKAAAADLLISLDTVPFRKNYFQNRNRILGFDGAPHWLTVPVHLDCHRHGEIRQVRIVDDRRWRSKYLRTLEQRYRKHSYFAEIFTPIAAIVERQWDRLADLNHALIDALREKLGIATPVLTAGDLGGDGSRSRLLADLCRRAGADVYLSGPSGREYLDLEPFRTLGIEVRFHDYVHPAYPQAGTAAFVSHLSVVDLLFNAGPAAGEILRRGSRIAEATGNPVP